MRPELMYFCHPPLGLLIVGLIATVIGTIFLVNILGVSERVAGFFSRHGRTGWQARYADRADAWRVFGAITVGCGVPLTIWSVVQC